MRDKILLCCMCKHYEETDRARNKGYCHKFQGVRFGEWNFEKIYRAECGELKIAEMENE